MDVGLSVIFQGVDPGLSDKQVYDNDLYLGSLAEELGFQSIWGVEHHFTDYTMCPDVTQFLSYWAGRNPNLGLGTMVIVLPWHEPIRVAEEVAMLDNMSDGRVILGIGRGLGRVEFEGFGRDMNSAREYFTESAEMILEGLETGFCEYQGKHVRQARRELIVLDHRVVVGPDIAGSHFLGTIGAFVTIGPAGENRRWRVKAVHTAEDLAVIGELFVHVLPRLLRYDQNADPKLGHDLR